MHTAGGIGKARAGVEEAGVKVERVQSGQEFEQALSLRLAVFCDEQGVPRELERDDEDACALHVIVRDAAGQVAATGRLLRQRIGGLLVAPHAAAEPGDVGRIGRMAVRRDVRGTGLGAQVIAALEQAARDAGLTRVVLSAQTHAQRFYERCGYAPEGERFFEVDIEHVAMTRAI